MHTADLSSEKPEVHHAGGYPFISLTYYSTCYHGRHLLLPPIGREEGAGDLSLADRGSITLRVIRLPPRTGTLELLR